MVNVGCGSKNGHERDMCWEEIRPRVQSLLIILDAIINLIWGTYVIISKLNGFFIWMMNRTFKHALQIITRVELLAWFGIANIRTLIECFISNEKWVLRETCSLKTWIYQSCYFGSQAIVWGEHDFPKSHFVFIYAWI